MVARALVSPSLLLLVLQPCAGAASTPKLRGNVAATPVMSITNSSQLTSYDEDTTRHSLNLAEASYCVDSTASSAWTCATCDDGITVDSVVEADGGRALVGYDSGQSALFVAYRGSSDIQNWIDNIDAFFTAPYNELSDVKVEAGFWDEYTSLSGGVKEALASAATAHGTHDVVVTGHSSGGSCATLLAFDIARGATDLTGFSVKSVITFGSPRVGNSEFVSAHAGYGLNSVRVTHYHDIVPHVPEEFMGYRHVVSEVWYAEDYDAAGSYTICNDSVDGEDDSCSNSCSPFSCTSTSDHLLYLGQALGADGC